MINKIHREYSHVYFPYSITFEIDIHNYATTISKELYKKIKIQIHYLHCLSIELIRHRALVTGRRDISGAGEGGQKGSVCAYYIYVDGGEVKGHT